MSKENLTLIFLKKRLLGQKVNINDSNAVVKQCISLAYEDMMTVGKYYLDSKLIRGSKLKKSNNQIRKDKFYTILKQYNFKFSLDLIKNTCDIFGSDDVIKNYKNYVTSFGLAQKLVNMTFKYLYIFRDDINQNIDFSMCDCPLDSIILNKLDKNDVIWSKLQENTYIDIQNIITKKVCHYKEYEMLGRLLYDFKNW